MIDETHFNQLLQEVASGTPPPPSAWLPWLTVSDPAERSALNMQIAKAYMAIGDLPNARTLAQRSFELSQYSLDTLPLFIEILTKINDVDGIKKAHKRAGIRLAAEGDAARAIEQFSKWQRAYADYQKIDKYELDPDVVAAIESMARPHQFHLQARTAAAGAKIKIGYLIGYGRQPTSVLLKLDEIFSVNYNRVQFSVTYAFLDRRSALEALPHSQALIDRLLSRGCDVLFAPEVEDPLDAAVGLGQRIAATRLDILVTNAVLSESSLWAYFIAALRPARKLISIVHGPVSQYSTTLFDHAICSFSMQIVDAPVPATRVNIELPLEQKKIPGNFRDQNGIPTSTVVLCCGGRYAKFQNLDHWKTLVGILELHRQSWLVVIGFSVDQIPGLEALIAKVRDRMKFIDWSSDYYSPLTASDIYLDSYPAGGGVLMIEALALDIPVVSFRHNFLAFLDGSEDSGAEDILGPHALVAERGNNQQFAKIVGQLIEQPELRRSRGKIMGEYIRQMRNDPQRMVRRFEEVYLKVAQAKSTRPETSGDTAYQVLYERLNRLSFKGYLKVLRTSFSAHIERILSNIFRKNHRR